MLYIKHVAFKSIEQLLITYINSSTSMPILDGNSLQAYSKEVFDFAQTTTSCSWMLHVQQNMSKSNVVFEWYCNSQYCITEYNYTANTLHCSYIYTIASYQSVVRLLHKKLPLNHNAENSILCYQKFIFLISLLIQYNVIWGQLLMEHAVKAYQIYLRLNYCYCSSS